MKKLLLLTAAAVMFSASANAGEYLPYVGFDYVNMSPNVSAKYPDSYDVGNIVAGLKFMDFGAVELFTERSLKKKETVDGVTSRGRIYGFGADVLLNAVNLSQGTILGSIGYGRISAKLKYNGKMLKDDGNDLRLGFGGELNPSPEWGFRAMFRYSLTDSKAYKNSKEMTIGARYYFY
ncbi:MAG: outer membrane beta-barrel protein [Alphaproteobacteria bacterium]|nr:outer membrane beta-barrel protein [Alphaproteobacteria bacterium]